jgi:heparosan-N-sulfate-glucuronate 5-epimerase
MPKDWNRIQYIILTCLTLSLFCTLLVPQFPFTNIINQANAETTPPKIIYDSSGIPLVYYGNQTGYQRNPVTISGYLIHICDNFIQTKDLIQLEYLKNNANWLIVNAKPYGNYSLLEYEFPFTYNMNPPWHSAMAQGLAIKALTKAYGITHNSTYINATIPLLNSFYVDVKDGGITEKTTDSGWWYEEYAGNGGQNPRVLNGMMNVLVSLHDYYNYTQNAKADYLFNQGVIALKNNIESYDHNGDSYYDSRKTTSPLSYQKVHVDLLAGLYEITGDPIFKKYHDKWQLYIESNENKSASTPEFGSIAGLIIVASTIGILIIPKRFRFFVK